MHKPLIFCLLFFLISTGCSRPKPVKLPANAILVTETTQPAINGYLVGGGNYFKRKHSSGEKRMSIMLYIVKASAPADAKGRRIVLFLGETLKLGEQTYKLHSIIEKEHHKSKAVLVPINQKD